MPEYVGVSYITRPRYIEIILMVVGVIFLILMQHIIAGSGRFLMWLAKRNLNSKNYLGLEIRKKVCC